MSAEPKPMTDPRPKSMSDRIAYAVQRDRAGLPLKAIAEEMGLSRTTISGYLRQNRNEICRKRWPRESVLERLRDWQQRYGRAPTEDEWSRDYTARAKDDPASIEIDGELWPSRDAVSAHFKAEYGRRGSRTSLEVALAEAGLRPYGMPFVIDAGRCLMVFKLDTDERISDDAFDALVDFAEQRIAEYVSVLDQDAADCLNADGDTQMISIDVAVGLDQLGAWCAAVEIFRYQLELRWQKALRDAQRFAQIVSPSTATA